MQIVPCRKSAGQATFGIECGTACPNGVMDLAFKKLNPDTCSRYWQMSKHRKKIKKLRRRIRGLESALAALKSPGDRVSPFAPAGGFPRLPVVKGIGFAAAAAGVKYHNRPDVLLVRADPGSVIAGVFTKSSTRSAAVRDCEAKLAALSGCSADHGLAVLVNSGNANAFTGNRGSGAVEALTRQVGQALGMPPGAVFSASTGVIGEPMPTDRVIDVIEELAAALRPDAIESGARAIMTTDTYPKGAGTELALGGANVAIAGFAKGSGMIAPDMATMLSFIFTDAAISQDVLQEMVAGSCNRSFNSVTVDGDTSTSDTLLVVATGCSGAPPISEHDSPSGTVFAGALDAVMNDLALQVAKDGEGATKFVEIRVDGAVSDGDAARVARSIANSPLVKTAIAGEDPNWGRVVMAVGKSGAHADRDRLSIRFGDLLVAEQGMVAESHSEEAAASYMKNSELVIAVDLGLGQGRTRVWSCDLSSHYVSINADYRS